MPNFEYPANFTFLCIWLTASHNVSMDQLVTMYLLSIHFNPYNSMIYDVVVGYVFLLRKLNVILPREAWSTDYPCK